ncbi:glycoside hydrolase domain-containing protein, partial [Streptomyces clavifer]|uniref:glycoside hydrolase domain-containing protein n=1 Tax=Streptomyces clavifer TaxID=68188 RepID=UPI0033B0289E
GGGRGPARGGGPPPRSPAPCHTAEGEEQPRRIVRHGQLGGTGDPHAPLVWRPGRWHPTSHEPRATSHEPRARLFRTSPRSPSCTKTLCTKTYRAGLYGFSSSSAKAIATAKNRTDLPGNLWYALWNGQDTTTKDWPWDSKLCTDHNRGHQYKANSKETHGGHTINVDRNAWDAPVAIIG